MQKFNAKLQCIELLYQKVQRKSTMHWTFGQKVQRKSSMHWTFGAKVQCKSSIMQLNFFTKNSMQKFNALNFRAEVLHWSFGSKVHCIAFFFFALKSEIKICFLFEMLGHGLIFVRFPWWNLETLKVCGELRIKLYRRKKTTYCAKWSADVQVKNGNPSQENFLGTLSKGQTVPFSNWNYRTNWESFDIHVV